MKISELNFSNIKQGMRFRGLKTPEKLGTVLFIDYLNDYAVHYKWDDENFIGLWFGVDCDCEAVQNDDGDIVIDDKRLTKEHRYLQKTADEALLKYFTKVKGNAKNKLFNLKTPTEPHDKICFIVDKMMELA